MYVKMVIKWVILPCILFSTAVALSVVYFFNSGINPNIRSFNHASSSIHNNNGVISGRFTAQDNYLSLVTIRFDNKQALNSDSVFRIKNVLEKDWYHIATIAALQYYTLPQYAFGIPVIAKSKNQTYQFEVQLLNNPPGKPNLTLNSKYPILISHYQFPTNILLKDKGLLIEFTLKKLFYNAFDESSWGVFAFYSIPLILYVLYSVFSRRILSPEFVTKLERRLSFILNPYMLFIFLCIGIDTFIIRKYLDRASILFTFLWIMGVIAYRLESRYSLSIALVFLVMCPFLLLANMDWIVEKSAIWAYMFLIVGTVHTAVEFKASESPRMNAFFNAISRALVFITHIDLFLVACAKKIRKFALFSFQNFILILIIFSISTVLFFVGFDLYLKARSYQDRQMKNPGTPLVEPALAYPGTKIFLYGDRFGDNSNSKYALIRDGERVRTDYWDDHKIIFTIPLGWKPGEMKLWIEKPVEWNAETVIEKTKPITIKLLKVNNYFTSDDDLYFEQLKSWKKETREMNGYK